MFTISVQIWEFSSWHKALYINFKKTTSAILVAFKQVLTCSWAAAAIWTARAADVAAAGVWTALAPADPDQDQQQQEAKHDQNNQKPICKAGRDVH